MLRQGDRRPRAAWHSPEQDRFRLDHLRPSSTWGSSVIPPSQSIDAELEAKLSLPAQSFNPVLSLSKHAWSPRPALRQAQGEVTVALDLVLLACLRESCATRVSERDSRSL